MLLASLIRCGPEQVDQAVHDGCRAVHEAQAEPRTAVHAGKAHPDDTRFDDERVPEMRRQNLDLNDLTGSERLVELGARAPEAEVDQSRSPDAGRIPNRPVEPHGSAAMRAKMIERHVEFTLTCGRLEPRSPRHGIAAFRLVEAVLTPGDA